MTNNSLRGIDKCNKRCMSIHIHYIIRPARKEAIGD